MGFVTCPVCKGAHGTGCSFCNSTGSIHTSQIGHPAPAPSLADTSVDWNKPLEPGPVHVPVPATERALAEHDAKMLGIGFLVDGKHVASSRVTVIERRHLEE